MKFSLFMMPCHQPGDNPTLAFQRDIGLIHLADALGFDEAYIGEHHSGGWETMPAPEMALSMAAANAKRIRLGTSVFSAPFHHPFYLAERMAFLDHLTRGRAILGVGPCSLVTDKMLFNMENEALYPMLHEAIEVIVRLLESDEPISHHGAYWNFDDMRLQLRSFQRPRMPLAMPSAATPANLEIIGKHDMIWLSPAGKNRPDARKNWEHVEKGARAAGRTANRDNWRIATYMYLADSVDQAWDEVRAGIMREAEYFSAIGLQGHYAQYPDQPFSEFTPESCADIRDWVIGTPDDGIAWLEDKIEKTGGFGGMLLHCPEWTDNQKWTRSMEMFARYVMPRFQGYDVAMHDEWRMIREKTSGGRIAYDTKGRPSNLTTREPNVGKPIPKPKLASGE
ncbi:MAG: LLM class flavin-dependent oxidoreductase [Alphaproteobacteria bacterium]|nr:LLM class flavin-dependent oxidoreductase [Alphaproteobacteria bacterium]